jgi:hypothetical protein
MVEGRGHPAPLTGTRLRQRALGEAWREQRCVDDRFESEEAAQAAANMFRTNPPPTVTPHSIEVGEVQEHA